MQDNPGCLRNAVALWLLLLVLLPAGRAAQAQPDCRREELLSRLGLEDPALLVVPMEEPGAAVLKLDRNLQGEELFWFAYTREGQLFTNIQQLGPGQAERAEGEFERTMKDLIMARAPFYGCPEMIPPKTWGEPDFNRLRAWGILAGKRQTAARACTPGFLSSEFQTSLPDFKSLRPDNPGVTVLFSGSEAPAAVWFGWDEHGTLHSTCRIPSLDTDEEQARCRVLISRLEQLSHLSLCPLLRVDVDQRASSEEVERALDEGTERNVVLGPELGDGRGGPLDQAINLIILIAIMTTLAAGCWFLPRAVRAEPLFWGAAAGVFILGAGARLLAGPMEPVSSGNGDLTVVKDAGEMLITGISQAVHPGNAPVHRVLLYLLFSVFGVSWSLASLVTVLFGAATGVAVMVAVRGFSGNPTAAGLAGIAMATWPLSLFFSSGCVQVIPSAFYLTSAFALWSGFLRTGSRSFAFLHGLLLFLFVQSRPEAAAVGAGAGLVMFLLLVDAGRVRTLGRSWWIYALFAAGMVPYGWFFTTTFEAGDLNPDLGKMPLIFVVLVASGFLLARLTRSKLLLARSPRVLRGAYLSLILVLISLGWLGIRWSGFFSEPVFDEAFPRAALYSVEAFNPLISVQWLQIFSLGLEANVVPFFTLPLILFGLLPDWKTLRLGPGVPLLIALVLFGYGLSRFRFTGILPVEGFRYKMPESGLVLILVGLGIARVLEWVRGVGLGIFGQRVLTGILALLMLSPLVSHRAFYLDGVHNPQQEFNFVREMVALLPEGAEIILPEVPMMEEDGAEPDKTVAWVFRTGDLIFAAALIQGKTVHVRSIHHSLVRIEQGLSTPGSYLYLGLDCHRVEHGQGLEPLCKAGRGLTTGEPLLARAYKNRVYSTIGIGLFSPRGEELLFEVRPISDGAVPALFEAQKRRYQDFGWTLTDPPGISGPSSP